MAVSDETSLIERQAAPGNITGGAATGTERRFAVRFLYGWVAIALAFLITVAALTYFTPFTSSPLLLGGLAASGLLLLVAAIMLLSSRTFAAGILALLGGLVGVVSTVVLTPYDQPALLLGALLVPLAAVVLGAPAAVGAGLVLAPFAALPALLTGLAAGPALVGASGTALLGIAVAAMWRHAEGAGQLARQNDADLARLGRQADEQRAELRQVAGVLEHERQQAAALVEELGDGVAFTDAAGLVRRANPAARLIWQSVVGGEIVGQPLTTLREQVDGAVELRSLADGDEASHVIRDRRAIEQAERLRGELMQLIAVEMRNPLTGMLTALEMTLGDSLPDGTDRVLAGARRSGQRLLETVTALQEISELELSPASLRLSPSPLRPLIEASVAQATPLAQQGAVGLVVEYNADGTVAIDADRLRRAMLYLLDHAIRMSPAYSTVLVQTERQEDEIVVRVADQGPGIEPEELPLVFHRYVARSDQGNVPALGLTFCRVVVEAHGGRVWVENTGHGSSFAIALPLSQ